VPFCPPGRRRGREPPHLDAVCRCRFAVGKSKACQRFELPTDRVGDLVIISTRHRVLDTTPKRHDLSGLTEPLRSHGGLTEQTVPMIVNRQVDCSDGQTRNFDIFHMAVSHVRASLDKASTAS
jgi:phosphonoacetate hydrolase